MWPFSKKYSIASSGILQGLTDWHCHLLPGVDDGVRTMEESLQILSSYEQHGIKEVWLTPHIMEDIPNSTALLRTRYSELKTAYSGPIILHLASENMLDNLFEERLQQGDLLPIGDDGRQLLVETSYFNPPYGLHDILKRIKSKGYFPVLAHPERYIYMGQKDYQQVQVIKRMVRDLNFDLDIVMAPIVREPSGLARSSRNTYLSAEEKEKALAISKNLLSLKASFSSGSRTTRRPSLATVAANIEKAGLRLDYLSCVDAKTLEPRKTVAKGCCVLVAAYDGKTRLIDNVLI